MKTESKLCPECGAKIAHREITPAKNDHKPGSSTAPWDQPRNGTTITLWDGEPRELPPGVQFHSATTTHRELQGKKQHGTMHLISWPNRDYRGEVLT